jgi:CAAX prenyl protease-like protein
MTVPPDLEPLANAPPSAGWTSAPVLAHALPFLAWIVLKSVLDVAVPDQAWKYAVLSLVGALLLVTLRPWRYYPRPQWRHVPLALLIGVVVLAIWVVPFLGVADGMPLVQELYLRFGVLPLGRLPAFPTQSLYSPELCGWPLTLVRLGGSAFIIAVAEEFFWRGFLYRRLLRPDFLKAPLGQFEVEAFCWSVLLFGLEHREVVAGILAGAIYGLLIIRTRDIWTAVVAHVLTNLLLGIYVIRYDAYGFW